MSTLSDVQALYGSARNVWAKSQAHVIAHLVLAGVVFGVCQASIPELPVARFDLKQITENEWFKLSKDVGIVYASFVIPVIVVAVYSAALRVGGQFLVAVVMVISATSSRPKQSRLLYSSVLEPIALTLGKADFELADLRIKASDLALKYQSKKDVRWDAYQQSLSALTKNAQIYLGDFLLFLLLWITLFKLMPQAPWVQMNGTLFYPVAVILAGLALFAWFRVSRAIAVIPDLLLMSVSEMIRTDPDMTALLEVPKEKLAEVREKIGQLLRK